FLRRTAFAFTHLGAAMTGTGEPSSPATPRRRAAPRPLPVAVDTMGGDHAPEEIIAGAVAAVRDHDVRLVLVGQAPRIRRELDRHGVVGTIPIVHADEALDMGEGALADRKSTRLNSSHVKNSYAVFCLKKKTIN